MDSDEEAAPSVPSSKSCPRFAGSAKFSKYDEPSDSTATGCGICRAPVILVMTPEFPIESLALFLDRIMTVLPAPLRHCFQTAPEPLPHGPNMNREGNCLPRHS